NHPNIATIHGNVEDMDGAYGLVLELVDGPTLADRIAQGPMTLAEALPIAQQIAEALKAAHERAIVHRDVKPANIKFTRDGLVKVLDFGLAKVVGGEADAAVAGGTPSGSRESLPVGTPAYMSPRQAQGHPVDERTDIWAFGCVLYEMLTGRRAFPGNDLTETIAAVLHAPIDWDRLPADTPAPVRHLLRRCLERDRSARLRDITMAHSEIRQAVRVEAPENRLINSLMTRRLGWSVGVVFLIGIVVVGRVVARYGYATS